jgi:predicted RNA binding protein YcfA (HicA-like mRNA interferase family)
MSRLPTLKGTEVVRCLERAGFTIARIRGSHYIMEHPEGRRTVVPVHAGKDIRRSLLRKIIADAEMTEDTFQALI